jgi:hypothetical protein
MGDLRLRAVALPEAGLSKKMLLLRMIAFCVGLGLIVSLLAGIYIFLSTHGTKF